SDLWFAEWTICLSQWRPGSEQRPGMQQASNCRADAVKLNMFIVSFKIVTFLNLTGVWRFGRIPIATKTGRFCEVSEPPRGTRVTPTSFAMILGEKAPEHWRRW